MALPQPAAGRPSRVAREIDVEDAIEEAVASVRLEGLEPTPEFHALAERTKAGEISIDEFVRRVEALHGV
ncbi:MAG: antitoxin VbhA family protein [Actinobacteria bacterium]|nr:antitoxin VbhA family protein [Actinomycetota bacterium]